MAFSDLPQFRSVITLLQSSLAKGRLAHAYLLSGDQLEDLERLGGSLAKTLNCLQYTGGFPRDADACERCSSCGKVDHLNHADVRWIRPETKTRIVSVEQIRELLHTVYLKPTEGRFKVAVIVSAERLNTQAANAFLKTLEEPPPNTVFILISTEPQRLIETILSRCLRLNCGGAGAPIAADAMEWVGRFSSEATGSTQGLSARYRLLDQLLLRLGSIREQVDQALSANSPLEEYEDADPKLIERWKLELAAAVEAEYRRRRAGLLLGLQFWFRDIWLEVQRAFDEELATFPQFAAATRILAARLDLEKAVRNLDVLEDTQRLLQTNVQEALALEIGMLKLSL